MMQSDGYVSLTRTISACYRSEPGCKLKRGCTCRQNRKFEVLDNVSIAKTIVDYDMRDTSLPISNPQCPPLLGFANS